MPPLFLQYIFKVCSLGSRRRTSMRWLSAMLSAYERRVACRSRASTYILHTLLRWRYWDLSMLGEKSDSAVGVVVGGANRIAVARLLPIYYHMAGGCCVVLCFGGSPLYSWAGAHTVECVRKPVACVLGRTFRFRMHRKLNNRYLLFCQQRPHRPYISPRQSQIIIDTHLASLQQQISHARDTHRYTSHYTHF